MDSQNEEPASEQLEAPQVTAVGRIARYIRGKSLYALAGGLGMASLAACRNYSASEELPEIVNASVNQFTYSFFSTFVMIPIHDAVEKVSQWTRSRHVVPIAVPTALTTIASYFVHYNGLLKESADPSADAILTLAVMTVMMPMYHFRNQLLDSLKR